MLNPSKTPRLIISQSTAKGTSIENKVMMMPPMNYREVGIYK
jgi:hypothetical protein